jgi:alcohol dehydrogenase class IV
MNRITMFQTTPRIVFGAGAVERLAGEAKRLSPNRILIVTDPGIVQAGIAERIESILENAGLKISRFDKVEPDPKIEIALDAADALESSEADLIIGIGGGSSLDIAKVSAVLAANGGDISDLFGVDVIPKPGKPTILVPTTAGTGSEVTPIAILSDETEKLKKGIVSPYLYPNVALLDPELTLKLPPAVTAASGMDALIHAVEAFTSKNATPFTDLFAKQAITQIHENLRTAFADGDNLAARSAMLEGSMIAGFAFANAGVTAVHAFAYPIGAEFHIPHGVANSIMLVPVMEFNMIGNLQKFAQMAECFGIDTLGLTRREAAEAAVNAMQQLARDVEIPERLRDFGIKEEDIPDLAEGVLKVTRLLANNPRTMSKEDAERIYRNVW